MSQAEKAKNRLLGRPADFTWNELTSLMASFGYELKTTGGSSRKFVHPVSKATLMIHQPHPANLLKAYQVADALRFLKQEKHL